MVFLEFFSMKLEENWPMAKKRLESAISDARTEDRRELGGSCAQKRTCGAPFGLWFLWKADVKLWKTPSFFKTKSFWERCQSHAQSTEDMSGEASNFYLVGGLSMIVFRSSCSLGPHAGRWKTFCLKAFFMSQFHSAEDRAMRQRAWKNGVFAQCRIYFQDFQEKARGHTSPSLF